MLGCRSSLGTQNALATAQVVVSLLAAPAGIMSQHECTPEAVEA